MTDYTDSIATGFGGSFHFASFKQEVEDSAITGFTVLNRDGDTVTTTADASQRVALDTLVSNHVGTTTTGKTQQAKSSGESTNDTTTYDDKLSKTAVAVKKGDYLLTFFAEIKTSVADTSAANVRALLDGVEQAVDNWAGDKYHVFSGSGPVTFSEGDTPVFKIQFKRVGAAATITIRRAYAALVPVTVES